MLALALLPLVCYFAFLTKLHLRKTPTLLNGYLDFTLLAWGLFGLITLGPGRLLIPLYVFIAWDSFTWVFWFGFYFAATHILALQFRKRFIVYHCQRELVLPPFFTLARQIDPKTEWSGNVLSLHGLGVQWTVTSGRFGGHLLFVPTNPYANNPHRGMLEEKFANLCKTLEMPKKMTRCGWGGLTLCLFCLTIGLLLW